MEKLTKEDALFERDEKGDIIPKEVVVEGLEDKPTITIIPLTRGEIRKLFSNLTDLGDTTKDQDGEIILKHCIEPKFTEEDLKTMKWNYSQAIVSEVFKYSGINVKTDTLKKAMEKLDETLKKKSISEK